MKGATAMTVLEYPLSPKYIPNWTIGEALRELIANAFDIDAAPDIRWENGAAIITDNGPGILRSFWVIGEGNHGEIGQFGEGLKMAMLVLARDGRSASVTTAGYSVTPGLSYSETYGSKVLTLTSEPNVRDRGTVVRVVCTKAEFKSAHDRFLKLRPRRMAHKELGMLKDGGQLYINGVYASKLPAFWGYNITDKTMANRDRTVLDMGGVKRHITTMLLKVDSTAMITALLNDLIVHRETRGELAEHNVYGRPEYPKVWKAAFRKVFGLKACLSGGLQADNYMLDLGYTVIGSGTLGYSLAYCFSSSGVETSDDLISTMNKDLKFDVIDDQLTPEEMDRLDLAISTAKHHTPRSDVQETHVVAAFPKFLEVGCNGVYYKKVAYISREVLNGEWETLLGVMIHERIHGEGYDDVSRDFENRMTELIGVLAAHGAPRPNN
jgi:hypothetical protein